MRYVQYDDWENKAYGALVENAYRETAVMVMQRAVRKKAHSKGVNANKYLEHVNHIKDDNYDQLDFSDPEFVPNLFRAHKEGRITLEQLKTADERFVQAQKSVRRLFQEPLDEKYLEHVAHIEAGNYQALDFTDDHFIRNIFKALRLNKITLDQMLMAQSAYQAKEWLHDYDYSVPQVNLHSFKDDDSSWKVKSIDYMTDEQWQIFLDELAPKDEKYIAVNFSKFKEALVFSMAFESYRESVIYKDALFFDCFIKFLKHSNKLERSDKEKLSEIENLGCDPGAQASPLNNEAELRALEAIVVKVTKEAVGQLGLLPVEMQNREKDTASFFLELIFSGMLSPFYGLSCDYKVDDHNTPTLCFLIPTLTAETQLQIVAHGVESTLPVVNAGAVNVRMIRAYDERPAEKDSPLYSLFSSSYQVVDRQARPVEITHPDLNKTLKPHGLDSYDILLTKHDFFHCWFAGAIFKDFLRYERRLLSQKGVCQKEAVLMSKSIWETVDMSFAEGVQIRRAKDNRADIFVSCVQSVLWSVTVGHFAVALVTFIDFIRNPETWNSFVRNFDSTETRSFNEILLAVNGQDNSMFNYYFQDKELIQVIKNNPKKPNEYFILRAILKDFPEGIALLDQMGDKDFSELFVWGRDEELHLKKEHALLVNSDESDLKLEMNKPKWLAQVLEAGFDKILNKGCGKHDGSLGKNP